MNPSAEIFHHEHSVLPRIAGGVMLLVISVGLGVAVFFLPEGGTFSIALFLIFCGLMAIVSVILLVRAWKQRGKRFILHLDAESISWCDPLGGADGNRQLLRPQVAGLVIEKNSDTADTLWLQLVDGQRVAFPGIAPSAARLALIQRLQVLEEK
jgi:hypothetical protein